MTQEERSTKVILRRELGASSSIFTSEEPTKNLAQQERKPGQDIQGQHGGEY